MKLQRQKLKALSDTILDLYQPRTGNAHHRHLVNVLAQAFSTEQIATYNELPSPASSKLVVVTNVKTEYATPYYPVFERYMFENPLVSLLFKTKNVPATRLSDLIGRRKFRKTNIYNEYYRNVGIDALMACGFVKNSRAIGISFSRKDADFTSDELFLFDCLVPHIRQSLDLSQALEKAKGAWEAEARLARCGGWGSIGFRDDDRISFVSRVAEDLAESCFGCRPREGQRLPSLLRDCVRTLMGNQDSEVQSVRRPLSYHLPDGGVLFLRYAFDSEHACHSLVFEHRGSLSDPQQLRPLGITPREMDIAYWVAQNKTNWEISKILGISSKTVEKHMENIFKKLGLSSRLQFITKVQECVI